MICYIGVGSNLGNRLGYIRKAIALLKKSKRVKVKKVSSVYETVPVGGPVGQRKYLNLALKVQTRLLPSDLLLFLKETERKAGRKKRNIRWSSREIDLDLLLYGDKVISFPDLRVPHPLLHERLFMLQPLSDIAGIVRHPVLKKTIKKLLGELKNRIRSIDKQICKRFNLFTD